MTQRQLKFVEQNIDADTSRLRFRYHGDAELMEAIDQIDLRRKSGDKFRLPDDTSLQPAWLYGSVSVEQSTSALIAQFHASLASDTRRVLDLTMGLGIDALAFAMLNHACVTAVELNPELAAISAENYASVSGLQVVNADSVSWLANCKEQFDLIFIDPARRAADGSRVYNVHDCTPDVTSMMSTMLDHSPRVMVKLSPMLDIKATLIELPKTRDIYIVEQKGECRELLADVHRDFSGEASIVAVNGDRRFAFKLSEEAMATSNFGVPQVGDVLYEPWPAVMKAGPWNLLCERFGCRALNSNSHIYFSSDYVVAFPGKAYCVECVLPYSSSVIKRFRKSYSHASVAVRNFPETADRLRARLHVGESSSIRVIGTTDSDMQPLLIVCSALEPVG